MRKRRGGKGCWKLCICRIALIAAAVLPARGHGAPATTPTVYVSLWFDTEDYLLPASDDSAKKLAEIFTSQGVRATFKIVGEKARVLRQRGRNDVIAALRRHDIGYHTNFHSVHPTPAEYERDLGWDEGVEEFLRREEPGLRDLRAIFHKPVACYGQPGSSWTPQSYGALRGWGIPLYLDDTPHVGLEGKPFWYGGVLNALNLKGYTTRAELDSDDTLQEGFRSFDKVRERVAAEGGGLISIYYHPCEWTHRKFWDAVNFTGGANPPRDKWQAPPQRDAADTAKRFERFARYLEYIRTRPGVKIVTASDIVRLYPDRALQRPLNRGEIVRTARLLAGEVTYVRLGDKVLSAADATFLLARATCSFAEHGRLPDKLETKFLFGPAGSATGAVKALEVPWPRWVEACRDFVDAAQRLGRIPTTVWVAGKAVSPASMAAALGATVGSLTAGGGPPESVRIQSDELTAARYVAADGPGLWGWIIFPKGFLAPAMMELAKRQAWTLKPAVLRSR